MQHTYSIAKIIGEELNLASWQSSTKSLNLNHQIYGPPIFPAIQYIGYIYDLSFTSSVSLPMSGLIVVKVLNSNSGGTIKTEKDYIPCNDSSYIYAY